MRPRDARRETMVRRSRVRGDFRRLRRRGKRARGAVREMNAPPPLEPSPSRVSKPYPRASSSARTRARRRAAWRYPRTRGGRGTEVLVVDARGDGSERSRRRSFAAAAEERVRRRRFGSVGRGFRVRSRPFREHRDARPEMRGRSRRGEASERRDSTVAEPRSARHSRPTTALSRRFLAARFFLRPGRRDAGERRRVGEHHGQRGPNTPATPRRRTRRPPGARAPFPRSPPRGNPRRGTARVP